MSPAMLSSDPLRQRAAELGTAGEPFAPAPFIRAESPTRAGRRRGFDRTPEVHVSGRGSPA
jgi:hypothetical protein